MTVRTEKSQSIQSTLTVQNEKSQSIQSPDCTEQKNVFRTITTSKTKKHPGAGRDAFESFLNLYALRFCPGACVSSSVDLLVGSDSYLVGLAALQALQ